MSGPAPEISVVVPTHNPDPGRLRRTLEALAAQTLPASSFEVLLVDNASQPPVSLPPGPPHPRMLAEPRLGLTAARRRGFSAAGGAILVLADDDNVLAPDYLAEVRRIFSQNPRLGAAGGRSVPEFERAPQEWQNEFLPLLALRDPGPEVRLARGRPPEDPAREYPVEAAPIGAGMALRREALRGWMDRREDGPADRRGRELSSGGDNDIVLTLLNGGWDLGYFPELSLTHLIPASRLDSHYLARLNRGIQKSWLEVLLRHRVSPWPRIPRWSVPLRQAKAWFTHRAWAGAPEYIRWQGACGHFEGRAA